MHFGQHLSEDPETCLPRHDDGHDVEWRKRICIVIRSHGNVNSRCCWTVAGLGYMLTLNLQIFLVENMFAGKCFSFTNAKDR